MSTLARESGRLVWVVIRHNIDGNVLESAINSTLADEV
jgi:hypothetical protein